MTPRLNFWEARANSMELFEGLVLSFFWVEGKG